MKKIFIYISALFLSFSLASCDKIFDNLEGDLSKMSESDLTANEAGLQRLLSYAYNSIPMGAFSTGDQSTMDATGSHSASYSINTTAFSNYKLIRHVNKLFDQIEAGYQNGAISEEMRDYMFGEAHFIRAYYYFGMVRVYGGMPIIEQPLDDAYDGGEDISGLLFPRNTEKETWDYVISEFEKAAELLPATFGASSYRANKYAAWALEGRAALYAASVSKYWNKAPISSEYKAVEQKLTYMESSYAKDYYKKCIEACKKVIESGVYSLYGANPASVDEAKANLQALFTTRQDSEFIFGKSYELGVGTATNGFDYGNSPNQAHSSGNGWQWGRYSVTLNLVDAFDDYNEAMGRADGTVKTRNDGVENEYVINLGLNNQSGFSVDTDYIKYDDPSEAFAKKDARFQAHVIYPGCTFRATKINIQGGIIKKDGKYTFYNDDSEELNGKTYYTFGGAEEGEYSAFHLMDNDNQGNWYNSGFGVAKFLDPSSALQYSQNPWPDIRYAEVLLNYAEAVVESGEGDAVKAKEYLNAIRHRAAFKDDIDLTLENVLHERRVELAFEYDLSYTLHRRRAYVFGAASGINNRKRALVPVVDLRGSEAKYILVRANVYHGDVYRSSNGLYINDYRSYYGSVPEYVKNQITPNPIQQ
ncbi:MAG: RagB/SusD family nutrient uptake outer membrane protein [Bacteroidales bacterium]|nr:RagB/SusD family nutrient uptake outer membrane protein [Bacteroidales bacterium]